MYDCTPRRMKMKPLRSQRSRRAIFSLRPLRLFSRELLRSRATPGNDESLGAHASGVLLLGNQTSTQDACAPRVLSEEN
jgi:hypothetical protein